MTSNAPLRGFDVLANFKAAKKNPATAKPEAEGGAGPIERPAPAKARPLGPAAPARAPDLRLVPAVTAPAPVDSIAGPELLLTKPVGIAVEELLELCDVLYRARSLPHMRDFACDTIAALSADARRRDPGAPWRKMPLHALEMMHNKEVSAGFAASKPEFTRGRRLWSMLHEVPAWVSVDRIKTMVTDAGNGGPTEDYRAALPMAEVFMRAHPDFNVSQYEHLDIAKTTPKQSLKDPVHLAMRRVIPDIGAPLFLAAMSELGYEGENGIPTAGLIFTNFPVQTWGENVLADLRRVLAEDNQDVRGECYCALVERPADSAGGPYTVPEYLGLVKGLRTVRTNPGMTVSAREEAARIYSLDPVTWDRNRAEYERINRVIDRLQTEALLAVDCVLSYVRFCKADKAWRRDNETALNDGVPVVVRSNRRAPTGSTVSPDEAVRRALADGLDYGELGRTEPTWDAEAMGFEAVKTKKALAGGRLEGGWRTVSGDAAIASDAGDGGGTPVPYKGVVWEVAFGPLWAAMDPAREFDDLRTLVLVPRRENGLGTDMSQARYILMMDFEFYFEPVSDE